jgi:hypothetical protein
VRDLPLEEGQGIRPAESQYAEVCKLVGLDIAGGIVHLQ